MKANLALMCKSHNYKLDPYSNEYRVGNWVISQTRREELIGGCLLYTSPSPRDGLLSRMPSSA